MFSKLIGITALLVFCVNAHAANVPQAANVFQTGGGANSTNGYITSPLSNISNQVNLFTYATGATPGNYYALSKLGGTTGQYRVSAGKIAYCQGFYVMYAGSPISSIGLQIGQGSGALAGQGTATPPSGNNPFGFSSTLSESTILFTTAGTNTNYQWLPFPVSFAAQSYPYIRFSAATEATVIVPCYEM